MATIPTRFPFEILERYQHYRYRNASELSLQLVLEFEGRVNEQLMARAIRLIVDVYPILGCSAQVGKRKIWWVRRNDLDAITWCDVKVTDDIEAEIHRFLLLPSAPWNGDPLLFARIIRGPKGDALCVKTHHAVSDALGFKAGLAVLIATYGKLHQNPDYQPEPSPPYTRNLHDVVRHMPLRKLAGILVTAWRERKALVEPPNCLGFPLVVADDKSDRRFAFHAIPPEKYARLRTYAKRHQADFNDLLHALTANAVLQVFNQGKAASLRFYVPIDLRRYYPACMKTEGPRNLSQFSVLTMTPPDDYSFAWLLQECHKQTERLSEFTPGLGGYLKMLWRQFLSNEKLTTMFDDKLQRAVEASRKGRTLYLPIMVSNSGPYIIRKDAFPGAKLLDARFVPMTIYNQFFFAVTMFQRRITFSIGYCDPERTGPLLQKVFQAIDTQVDAIVAAELANGAATADAALDRRENNR